MRNVLDLYELTSADFERIFAITDALKSKFKRGVRELLLPGRVLALLFEKPSMRTRVSFESAMTHLGGSTMFLGDDVGWGKRESASDFGRVISEYVDVIVCRAKSHHKVEELAKYCTCAVINGLTDLAHPCQALADLYTVRESLGTLNGAKLAYVGDANNVARSLAVACGKLGVRFSIAAPIGYQFDGAFLEKLKREVPQLELELTTDPANAVRNAQAVYTDVWTSMGQEDERIAREKAFAGYQVTAALMKQAAPKAIFMHCLPARRGEEVTDEVMDSPTSVIVPQAGNRMHAQKGLLAWILGAKV